MLVNFPNSNELLQYAAKENLYGKLVGQLHKDFKLANVPINFSKDEEPKHLTSILHEKIYYLILERFTDYLNLLYVIDVPEKVFKQIQVTDVVDVAEQVSLLILKLEWQKVWSREKYAS